jgi:hypothetical protein
MSRFDQITAQRVALFDTGLIELRASNQVGRMVPLSPEHQHIADQYNELAEEHAAMKGTKIIPTRYRRALLRCQNFYATETDIANCA